MNNRPRNNKSGDSAVPHCFYFEYTRYYWNIWAFPQ